MRSFGNLRPILGCAAHQMQDVYSATVDDSKKLTVLELIARL